MLATRPLQLAAVVRSGSATAPVASPTSARSALIAFPIAVRTALVAFLISALLSALFDRNEFLTSSLL